MFDRPNFTDELHWTIEAQIKLRKIPYFARTQARQRIEDLTRQYGLEEVTAAIVEQARSDFGQ